MHIFNDIFFINDQIGWAVADGVWKTVNGGESWTKTVSLFNTLTGIYFLDESIGYFTGNTITGIGGGIFKSTDGGSSVSIVFNGDMNSINFIDYNIGWAIGPNNKILKTTKLIFFKTLLECNTLRKKSMVTSERNK